MASPKARRNSCAAGTGIGGSNPPPPVPHPPRLPLPLGPASRTPCGAGAPPALQCSAASACLARPSPSVPAVALRSLLAVDVWLSRRMALCAGDEAPLGGMRPLVKLLEFTGHPAVWITDTLYSFISRETAEEQEIIINLFLSLLLDHALIRLVKRAVTLHRSEWFSTLLPLPHSFPSGHATRAAMCSRFLHTHLLLDCPMCFVALSWTLLPALTQVLLGQHNVSGVVLALAMGSCHYSVVETYRLSLERFQKVLTTALGETHPSERLRIT